MTTSLRVPNLDPSNRPALLSPAIVGLLRGTLHFGGVIVTDSLSMTAVGEPLPKATLDAAQAGNDLLLMSSGSTTLEDQACQMVLAAVRSEVIPQAQVQASAQRSGGAAPALRRGLTSARWSRGSWASRRFQQDRRRSAPPPDRRYGRG